MRTSDPATSMSGREFGIEWRPSQEFALSPATDRLRRRPSFLFEFRDLAASSFQRWFQLRDVHSRAIQIMVTQLRQRGVTIQAQLLQIGAAFDALGFQLIRDRATNAQAKRSSFQARALEVVGQLPTGTLDPNAWADELRGHIAGRSTATESCRIQARPSMQLGRASWSSDCGWVPGLACRTSEPGPMAADYVGSATS